VKKCNEELRGLIEQERKAYNDERDKFDSEISRLEKGHEGRLKLIKNKLAMLLNEE